MILNPLARASPIICSTSANAAPVPRMLGMVGADQRGTPNGEAEFGFAVNAVDPGDVAAAPPGYALFDAGRAGHGRPLQVASSVCSLPRWRQRCEFVAVVLRKVEKAAAPVGLAPLFLAIKSSGADIIGSYFTFESDLVIFARQLRQLGVNVPWVGSPSMVAAGALKLAGPAIWGTYAVADYAADSSPEAKEFAKLYGAVLSAPPAKRASSSSTSTLNSPTDWPRRARRASTATAVEAARTAKQRAACRKPGSDLRLVHRFRNSNHFSLVRVHKRQPIEFNY